MVAEPTNRPEPRYGSATIPKLLRPSSVRCLFGRRNGRSAVATVSGCARLRQCHAGGGTGQPDSGGGPIGNCCAPPLCDACLGGAMDVRQLQLFLAVLDCASVTRAAERVNLTPGAVSLQLQ